VPQSLHFGHPRRKHGRELLIGNLKEIDVTLQRAGDIAFILAALAVAAAAGQNLLSSSSSAPPPGADPVRVSRGQSMVLPGVDFGKSDRTLVLVASSQCPYCTNSMQFYRRLGALDARRGTGLRLVVVGQEDRNTLASYLEQHELEVDDVVRVTFDTTPSAVTATLILVGREGTVKDIWRGQLAPDAEDDVMREVS
jgi:hypothetical protein